MNFLGAWKILLKSIFFIIMYDVGITDLTPEGLLCGAKDIVALNRQLRKEVELLEREVVQLKEQHQAMNGINCHTSSSPPPHPPPAHHVMATVPSTVTSYPLPPPSLPPSLPPLPTTSPSLQLPPPKAMKVRASPLSLSLFVVYIYIVDFVHFFLYTCTFLHVEHVLTCTVIVSLLLSLFNRLVRHVN